MNQVNKLSSLGIPQTIEYVHQYTTSKELYLQYINQVCDDLDRRNPIVNAFLPEENRRKRLILQAQKLWNTFPDPSNRPPLFGLLVAVKDLFYTSDLPTRGGSQLPEFLFKEPNEGSFVQSLRKFGALILGKSYTTEFAFSDAAITRNPHNLSHTPGGSSSGSAAAVSAGFCSIGTATQTIGSIARPACYCGVVGFKPTYNRISPDGVIPFSPSVDHIGFVTPDLNTSEFTANAVIFNWRIIHTSTLKVIGIPSRSYLEQADKNLLDAFYDVVNTLKSKRVDIQELDSPINVQLLNAIHRKLIAIEFYETHQAWFQEYGHLYRSGSTALFKEGQELIKSQPNLKAECLDYQRNFRHECQTYLKSVDCMIAPGALSLPPYGLDFTGSPLMNLPWTHAGLPTISIPTGTCQGLPVGIQIIGKFGEDEELMGISKQIESLLLDAEQ